MIATQPACSAWKRPITALIARQPRVPWSLIRLYRIEPRQRTARPEWLSEMLVANGSSFAENRWFTDDPSTLAPYAVLVAKLSEPVLAILDVPAKEIEAFRADRCHTMLAGLTPKAFACHPEHDFFLPERLARERTKVGVVAEPIAMGR